jgi:hypothetical protein
VDLPYISYEILFRVMNYWQDFRNVSGEPFQNKQFYPKITRNVNVKILSSPKVSSGADYLYLPGLPSLVVLQSKNTVAHPDLKAIRYWSYPLLYDLVNLQPAFFPGKTPGAFMKSRA